jgi:hypothetical protein
VSGTSSTVEINLGADINSILEINDIRGRIINNAGVALDTEGKKSRSRTGSGGAAISISNVNGDVIVSRK